MRYWRYRAYDSKGKVVDGVSISNNPQDLMLELRQRGLQVYDLVTIQHKEYTRLHKIGETTIGSVDLDEKTNSRINRQRWLWLIVVIFICVFVITICYL